jgi:hypothetical protein
MKISNISSAGKKGYSGNRDVAAMTQEIIPSI